MYYVKLGSILLTEALRNLQNNEKISIVTQQWNALFYYKNLFQEREAEKCQNLRIC